MKGCNNFSKLLNDYITESLPADKSKFMLDHINSCENCRKLYELQLKRSKSIESISAVNEIDFISSREEIMTRVSDTKYNKRFSNKFYYFFRRNSLKCASVVALLILIISSGIWAPRMLNNGALKPLSEYIQEYNDDKYRKIAYDYMCSLGGSYGIETWENADVREYRDDEKHIVYYKKEEPYRDIKGIDTICVTLVNNQHDYYPVYIDKRTHEVLGKEMR